MSVTAQELDPRRARRRRRLNEALRLFALAAVVYSVWATVYGRWRPSSLGEPIEYWLDAMFNLGATKAGADFGFLPLLSKVNPRLGAPFAATWNDFPISEDHLFFFWGLVARWVGVIAAVNLGFVCAAIGAAISQYLVARWLKIRWEASLAAGALFGLSPLFFYRNIQHFTTLQYWHVPLFIVVWLWAGGRRGLDFGARRFRIALLIGALAGIQHVYYLNYFLQGVALCLLAQAFRRRWRKAAAACAVAAAAMCAFVATNFDSLWSQHTLGPNQSAVVRGVSEAEVYGLKPMELFTPGYKHRLFSEIGIRHRSSTLNVAEFPSPYLGMIGGLGFLLLLGRAASSLLAGRRPGWGRFGAFAVFLILTCSVGGGLQLLQAYGGRVLFRSNNRVSIVLLMLALLFFARALAHLARRWPRPALPALMVALVAFGAFEQSPSAVHDGNAPYWEKVPGWTAAARSDRRLVEELERRVAPGAMVFQLPPMSFPEGGNVGGVPDYDLFRPYLFAKTLRFSYGNIKGRPESQWQYRVAALPDLDKLAVLEKYGFGALYIQRAAYPPYQVAALLGAFRAAGRTEVIEAENGDSVVVLLKPSLSPATPSPDAML